MVPDFALIARDPFNFLVLGNVVGTCLATDEAYLKLVVALHLHIRANLDRTAKHFLCANPLFL